MNTRDRIKYEKYRVGDIIQLNESIVSESVHFDAGTRFRVVSFPPKVVKRDKEDKNKNGYLRDLFIYGRTLQPQTVMGRVYQDWPIRVNLNQVTKL